MIEAKTCLQKEAPKGTKKQKISTSICWKFDFLLVLALLVSNAANDSCSFPRFTGQVCESGKIMKLDPRFLSEVDPQMSFGCYMGPHMLHQSCIC